MNNYGRMETGSKGIFLLRLTCMPCCIFLSSVPGLIISPPTENIDNLMMTLDAGDLEYWRCLHACHV